MANILNSYIVLWLLLQVDNLQLMRKPTAKLPKGKLNRIKEVMDEKKITRYRVAKDTGITYLTIDSYYRGKKEPSLDRLFLVAKVLDVSPKDLLKCD
jgi:putative transcriptional regulator